MSRYQYFLYPPFIHILSLNAYLFITKSARAAILRSPQDSQHDIHFPPLSIAHRPLRFQCPLSLLSPRSLISPSEYHLFSSSLQAQISLLFHLPLSSSFSPSFNNLLSSITHFYLLPLPDSISAETKIKSLSVIGQSMQHTEMESGFCLQQPPFFYFVFGPVRRA